MTSEIRMEFVGYYDGQKLVDSEGNEIKLEDTERQPCEIWTRVMGYHRPKESFNKGKVAEFEERKYFTEENAVKGLEECNDNE